MISVCVCVYRYIYYAKHFLRLKSRLTLKGRDLITNKEKTDPTISPIGITHTNIPPQVGA